jgi:hypothetical protein
MTYEIFHHPTQNNTESTTTLALKHLASHHAIHRSTRVSGS